MTCAETGVVVAIFFLLPPRPILVSPSLSFSSVSPRSSPSRRLFQVGAKHCKNFSTIGTDDYFKLYNGRTCASNVWEDRSKRAPNKPPQANRKIQKVEIVYKAFDTQVDASLYTQKVWGSNIREPIPVIFYTDITASFASSFKLSNPLHEVSLFKVMIYDPMHPTTASNSNPKQTNQPKEGCSLRHLSEFECAEMHVYIRLGDPADARSSIKKQNTLLLSLVFADKLHGDDVMHS